MGYPKLYLAVLLSLFVLNSLCASIVTALGTVDDWTKLNHTHRFLIVVGIVQGATGTIIAFFTRSQFKPPKQKQVKL